MSFIKFDCNLLTSQAYSSFFLGGGVVIKEYKCCLTLIFIFFLYFLDISVISRSNHTLTHKIEKNNIIVIEQNQLFQIWLFFYS